MGKHKGDKSKEKKERRKQEKEQLAASLAVVKHAQGSVEGHFQELKAFQKYERNGLCVEICLLPVHAVAKEDVQWAFDLMKEAVMELYISGGWGWKDKDKWAELTDENAYFIIARSQESGKPCGFVNFRFDLDDGVAVAYCYEIHLSEEVRRKGLGKFLMQILELLAARTKMKKVVLTAFKENDASLRFFTNKLKYEEDETSPGVCDHLNAGLYSYIILSRSFAVPKAAQQTVAE